MKKNSPAENLFEIDCKARNMAEDMLDKILVILTGSETPDHYPMEDWHYDYYDYSFELDGCDNDLRLTEDQYKQIEALGFYHGWLNHKDGMETFYKITKEKGFIESRQVKRKYGNKKVWVVTSGCIYEGGGVDKVFATKERALEYAKAKAEEENKEEWRAEYVSNYVDGTTVTGHFYTTKDGKYWSDGTDYIDCSEWEVEV
jgi:hypothetical protein